MTDKPLITTIDEAKTALDEEIASVQGMAEFYQRRVEAEKASLARYEDALWRLKSVRRRMDPAPRLEAVSAPAEQVA